MVFQPLSLTNTYFEWLTTTNQIITSLNLNTAPIAFNTANAAFANGNANFIILQTVSGVANAAFANGNTNFVTLQSAFDTANAAFANGNTTHEIAIAAFNQANTANNLTVANTGTVVGSRNVLNFVPGANVVITFADDEVGNRVNVSIDTAGGGGAIQTSIVTGTTQTAVKDNKYILTNPAATTVTLPAAPSLGDTIYIVVANGLVTNNVGRNGLKIMSLEEDLTLDYDNISIGLVYANTTLGWRII
jgi:hypothetical protein